MKKFLLYLLVLVFMVSFVGLIFYLTRPDETISANSETVYLNIWEETTPSYVVENSKKSTKIELSSSDENVAKVDGNKIIANGKGVAVVSVTLTNARGKKQVIQEKIYVGDGSSRETPIYIRSQEDIKRIGSDYALNLYFKQTADITLTEELNTISGEFSGEYNGDNHKILNYTQTGSKNSSAFFDVVTGTVGLLTFENVDINGSFENASVVAKTNKGLIDYVDVIGKIRNTNTSGLCGGVVINNQEEGQIQRCVTKLNIISSGKVIGGIAAYNNAIITSCQNGDTSLKNPVNSDFEFVSLDGAIAGGIVAKNEFVGEKTTIISNCYSISQIKCSANEVYWFNGSWVKLSQSATNAKVYVNATDDHFVIDKEATENKYFIDVNKNDVYDAGTDTVLSVWDTASSATNTNIKFSNNCFLGGVVGADYNSGSTPAELESKKTVNIFGNYYLILTDHDLAQRGIGNVKNTTPSSSGNLYVANGLTYATVTDPNSIFVSYVITFSNAALNKLESWPTDVWVLDSSYFPYLISKDQVTDGLTRLSIKLPVIGVVPDNLTIDSADTFIQLARTGEFTNPENVNKTYYIATDLDFAGKDFVVVGSEERPVVVNFEGSGCSLSNITIVSSTKYRAVDTVSTIGEAKPASVGIFGVVRGSTISGLNLRNCSINVAGDIQDAKNVGGFAGKMVNGLLSDCSFISGVNESGTYTSSISATASAENIGSLVGLAQSTGISNCQAEIEIASLNNLSHSNRLYVGGLVGSLDAGETKASSIRYSSFNGRITTNINTSVFAGSAAGFVAASSRISSFSAKGVSVTAAYAGGIAAVVKGGISNSSVRTTLNTKNGGGFVYSAEDGANIQDCYCETNFTLVAAEVNAGMASQVSRNCHFTNCVNVNDFNNDGSASKNYSRMAQNVKFEFTCRDNKITELNEYGSGYAFDEIIMTNCFYVNRVAGEDSNDYNKTTFYTQTNGSVSGWFGINHVDSKVILNAWYNGSVRNGRLKTTGGLAVGPNTDATWNDFGFTSSIWSNASQGVMSATLYIA